MHVSMLCVFDCRNRKFKTHENYQEVENTLSWIIFAEFQAFSFLENLYLRPTCETFLCGIHIENINCQRDCKHIYIFFFCLFKSTEDNCLMLCFIFQKVIDSSLVCSAIVNLQNIDHISIQSNDHKVYTAEINTYEYIKAIIICKKNLGSVVFKTKNAKEA